MSRCSAVVLPTILLLFLFTPSCVSPETQKALEAQKNLIGSLATQLQETQSELNAAEEQGLDDIVKELQAKIKEQTDRLQSAETALDALEAKATEERITSGAQFVQKGAQEASPFVGLLGPLAYSIVNAIGLAAGAVANRKNGGA